MKKFSIMFLYLICLLGVFLSNVAMTQGKKENLYDANSTQTVLRQAGDYSAEHDVLTIAVKRGTAYRKEYDKYLEILSKKLDSLDVPHRYFQEFNEEQGTAFVYFIENDYNGVFNSNEVLALVPHIARRFKTEYQKSN